MKAVKKIIAIVSSILGGSLGIILLGLINWVFNLQLSFSTVFLSGVLGGVVAGNILGFYLAWLLVKRAKRFMATSVSGILNRFISFRRY